MGNSNGNLKEYWHYNVYNNPNHAGGFIWDWMDQGLIEKVPKKYAHNIGKGAVKETFYAYGGWHKQKYTDDNNFCMNGLIDSNWQPHPGLHALKWVYRNVHVVNFDYEKQQAEIRNWFDYTNLKYMATGTWDITENGKVIAQGKIQDLDIKPGFTKIVSLNLPELHSHNKEYFITFRFFNAKKQKFLPIGYEIAHDQFKISGKYLAQNQPKNGKLSVKKNTIKGDNFKVEVRNKDRKSGV